MTPPPRKRFLLVGWDSADWKIIRPLAADGQLPHVSRLIREGISGNLTTLEPQLSPMLWTSIATGKHAYHHGVAGFTEVNAAGQVVPVSAATRQCKTVWEILGENGLKSHVVSWFATQGERLPHGGAMVSNLYNSFAHTEEDLPEQWPPPLAGTYFPEDLATQLDTLRVSPWDMDGDEVMRLFVPDAPSIDQAKDKRLWSLAKRLAETFSVHAASCWLLENRPDWDFMAIYYRAIDEICHEFMPYHPPKLPGVSDVDFGLYREVVASAYRIHDLMLGRLMQLAGEDTATMLVSDHGFHSDHLRPEYTPNVPAGITVWHRPQGIITAKGPGLKKNETLFGARLLDITPTILTWFGLPVGKDMEGRVLNEAFSEKTPIKTIPSWEETTPHPSAQATPVTLTESENQALLDHFVALGYINAISPDRDEAAMETHRENTWNMARAYMDTGRFAAALSLLEEIHHTRPDRTDWAQMLARCQLRLGLLDEADATAEATLATFDEARAAAVHMIRANIAIEKNNAPKALEHLALIGKLRPRDLQFLSLRILALTKIRHWEECRDVCQTTLEVDPENNLAHIGLARCALRRDDPSAAIEHALAAIEFQYGNPRGHFLLGVALAKLENFSAAEKALGIAIQLAPRFAHAHRHLANVQQALGKTTEAAFCLQQSRLANHIDQATEAERIRNLRLDSATRIPTFIQKRSELAEAKTLRKSAMPADQEFILVSGLPRSGTSLMMQMLRAGGLELMTDGLREPDEDNPEGYWEWEDIKKLFEQPEIIEQAHGKATKVISALLAHLPLKHRFKIIFMTRPIAEVVTSQSRMLARNGIDSASDNDHLADKQRHHAEEVLAALGTHPRVDLLEISYPALISNPDPWSQKITEFLGAETIRFPEKLCLPIRPELYRNR